MYVISGNYFTNRYVLMLSNTVNKLKSSCYITYNDSQASLKSNSELISFYDVIPGKKVKISCFHSEYQQALKDLDMVRKLIEHDFTTAVESD